MRLVPFNSRAPVVTEFVVIKSQKVEFLKVYHFSISQYFLDVAVLNKIDE